MAVVIPLSLGDEEVSAQYTVTFTRADETYSGCDKVTVMNCSNGQKVDLKTSESYSFTTSSTTTLWYFRAYTAGLGGYNHNFTVNGQSGFQGLYYKTSGGSGTYKISVSPRETGFGLTTFDAGYNGGTFRQYNGNHVNKVSDADECIGIFNSRYFYKAYDGEAYCAWFWITDRWAYPMLVGKTANSVAYYQDYNYDTTTYAGTISYQGETWYFSGWGPLMQNCWNDLTYNQAFIRAPFHYIDDVYRTINSDLDLRKCVAEKMLMTLDTEVCLWEQGFSGGGIQFPDDPYKPFYSFYGWYTMPSGGTRITSSSPKAGENRTLYARYSLASADVYIDTDCDDFGGQWGGDGVWIDSDTPLSIASINDSYDFYDKGITISDLRKTGYHLTGAALCTSTRTRGKVYTLAQLESGISALTLYQDYYDCFGLDPTRTNLYMILVWEENQYLLKFSDDATGYYEEMWVRYSEKVTIYGITREGYTFQYYESPNCSSFRFYKGTNHVSELVSYGGFEHSNNVNISLIAVWEINTYQLIIGYTTYYDECVHDTDIWVEKYWEASIIRGEGVWIKRTYSTTPLTIKVHVKNLDYKYYMQWYVDGSWGGSTANGSITFNWTPTANMNVGIDVIELFSFKAATSEGVALAEAKSLWNTSSSWSSNTEWGFQGTGLSFKAGLKDGYVFDGWYKGSTKVSGNMEFTYLTNANPGGGGLRENLTLTAKAKKIYDMIEYDETNKYFYFEDGVFPQTYAGDSMNSTLNSWYSGKSTSRTLYINNILTNCYNYSGTEYARVKCPTTYTVKLKSGSSKTFSANSYYWFTLEPIRWRVSDYGVSEDYYSTTLYQRFISDGGIVNGVSEYVLDYDVIAPVNESFYEGWKYTDGHVHSHVRYNDGNANCISCVKINRTFDYFNNTGTNKKVLQETISSEGIYQASISDIDSAGITDYRAKATDLVCMFVGIDYGDYCSYSTRDLYNLGCGKSVTADGTVRNLWLNSACGVRFVYASTGKSS